MTDTTKRYRYATGLLLALSALPMVGQEECSEAPSHFVETQGADFSLDATPFHFVGANSYYLMTFAADPTQRAYVDEVLDDAAAMGVKVIRTWAFNDGSGWNALQTSPGVYDESVFVGLDYVLQQAQIRGLKLTFTLVNNWADYGGMDQYVAWSPTANTHDDFYTDSYTSLYYKNYLTALANRENSFTGTLYKNDPTIFAWELANEARCPSDTTGQTLNNWLGEMSTHLKAVDPNHMITTGSEGFYNDALGPWYLNGSQGVDYVVQHDLPNIDYAGAHSYPDHWGMDETETFALLERQILDSTVLLGKPFVLGEFGKWEGEGTRINHRVYDKTTWVDHSGRVLPAPGAWPTRVIPDPLPPQEGTRIGWYDRYWGTIHSTQSGGSAVWSLAHDARPDYDGFTLYYPSSVELDLMSIWAGEMDAL